MSAFEGLGFRDESLSYFPFSAGERSCAAKRLVVDMLCAVVFRVCSEFRLDCEESLEQDPGISISSTIVPALPSSTKLKVN